jgi:hypothetical protein
MNAAVLRAAKTVILSGERQFREFVLLLSQAAEIVGDDLAITVINDAAPCAEVRFSP